MRRKRKMNVVSVWIIVIFTVIAITLVSLFMLVYSSIIRSELQTTLHEQVEVLRDNADKQVVGFIQNQLARNLATKDAATGYISSLAKGRFPSTTEIITLTGYFTQVKADLQHCERIELYFPSTGVVIGSQGIQYLNDRKYTVSNPVVDYMRGFYPSDGVWMKRTVPDGSTTKNVYTYFRLYPGVFSVGQEPMLAVSIEEKNFLSLLRASVRTLRADDSLMLVDAAGKIWSAEADADAEILLAGTLLPKADLPERNVSLINGQRGMLAEAVSSSGAWSYVILHPSPSGSSGYGTLVSIWAILCVSMLFFGLAMVLRMLIKHYDEPMRRLVDHLAPNGFEQPEKSWKLSSPTAHFLQLETALSDMSKLKQERDYFITHNRPMLRQAWLNCFIYGEAYYAAPQAQLEIVFPHPNFQVVMTSAAPSETEMEIILNAFDEKGWIVEAFESREKENVLLFNHAFTETCLSEKLLEVAQILDSVRSSLVFGVGVCVPSDEGVAASYRCARRALSSKYFVRDQRVCVFDPTVHHAEAESTLTQIISQLTELTGLIRRENQQDVDQAIDSIVSQLKETMPYLNTMRSIMLLAAMFLSKVVYDMKGAPENVYGENLLNAYYHISDIGEFSERLKKDSAMLREYLTQESSPGNRSVVQYAIHHIQSSAPADLSIHSIAEAIGISTGHLSRMFHQETGRKLVDYLQEVRMESAAKMLRESTMSNEEICEKIGYSRLQYFAGKFKEHYGLTLNEYRRQFQQRNESAAE